MNRGDLWIVSGGVASAKPRPVLIVRDDDYVSPTTVTVVPLTSQLNDTAVLVRFRIEPSPANGLSDMSDVMIDRITTIKLAQIPEWIGRISNPQLAGIERLMGAYLGLGR